jgi:hypothetical protein
MRRLTLSGGLLLPVICGVVVWLLGGCVYGPPPPPPPPGPPVAVYGYDYYYYPDDEVYFYPDAGIYFWFGGGGWHQGRRLPHGMVLHGESRVTVNLHTARPYEQHETVRARYPGHGGGEARPMEGGGHGPR